MLCIVEHKHFNKMNILALKCWIKTEVTVAIYENFMCIFKDFLLFGAANERNSIWNVCHAGVILSVNYEYLSRINLVVV